MHITKETSSFLQRCCEYVQNYMVSCSQSGILEGYPHHWHWPWLGIRELRSTQVCRCWESGSQCFRAKKAPRKKLKHQLNKLWQWLGGKRDQSLQTVEMLREKDISKRWKQVAGINGPQSLQMQRNKVYVAKWNSKCITLYNFLERESQFNSVHMNFSSVSLT